MGDTEASSSPEVSSGTVSTTGGCLGTAEGAAGESSIRQSLRSSGLRKRRSPSSKTISQRGVMSTSSLNWNGPEWIVPGYHLPLRKRRSRRVPMEYSFTARGLVISVRQGGYSPSFSISSGVNPGRSRPSLTSSSVANRREIRSGWGTGGTSDSPIFGNGVIIGSPVFGSGITWNG